MCGSILIFVWQKLRPLYKNISALLSRRHFCSISMIKCFCVVVVGVAVAVAVAVAWHEKYIKENVKNC